MRFARAAFVFGTICLWLAAVLEHLPSMREAHAQVGPGSGNAPYQYTSSGAGQYAISIGSATTLTIPAGSLIAEICVDAAAARYTTTGTTPTSSVGIPVVPQSSSIPACFQLSGIGNLTAFKIIGSGATMDVEYFR